MSKKLYIKNLDVYKNILNKNKKYEMRINKGFIKTLKKNNIIYISFRNEEVKVKIVNLLYFKNIYFLMNNFDINKIIPKCDNSKDFLIKFNNYYSNKLNDKIVLIKIEII